MDSASCANSTVRDGRDDTVGSALLQHILVWGRRTFGPPLKRLRQQAS
jgi:hypothetical protein